MVLKIYTVCIFREPAVVFPCDETLRAPPIGKTPVKPVANELLPWVLDPQVSGTP